MATGKPKRRPKLRATLFAALLLCLAILAAGFLGGAIPPLDLANIAQVPAAIAAIILAIMLAFLTRRWPKRAVYAGVIALAAYALVPPPSGVVIKCSGRAEHVRIAWLNLQGSTEPQPILDWLEKEKVSVVAFGELHASVEPTRSAILSHYPHWQSCLPNGRCSTLIAAKHAPLSSTPLSRGDVQNRQTLSAARMTFETEQGNTLRLVAAHLSRPPHIARQRQELAQLQLLLDDPANTVVIGDFNMTRRMHGLRDFAGGSGLVSTPANRATWPLRWKGRSVTPFVQIDHVLTGRNWRVSSLSTSEDLGSDHRGIVTQICSSG